MKSASMAEWPVKVRRRDGTLAPFDVRRIEAAVARAGREVGYDDPDMPAALARTVADALGPRVVPIEQIQDYVEARLGEAGLDDVARAYIIYRQRRNELRMAKALLGVRDELKLGLSAVTVLRKRYLLCDEQGRPTESTGEMMDRAARFVAGAEDGYRRGTSTRWAERFSALLRNLEFLPNSPTLMNAGTDIGLLAGCFVLPMEDSLHSIFTTLGHAAEIHALAGALVTASATCDPPGIECPLRAAPRAARIRFFGCSTPRRMWSRSVVVAAAHAWRCSTRHTPISMTSSPPKPKDAASFRISTCRSASPTRSCAPSNAAAHTA